MKKVLSIAVVLAMLVSLFGGTLVVFSSDSAPVETEYGTIPAEYADSSAYPIAVFFSDKTFWHAGADWKTAMDKAIDIAVSHGYGVNVLIRSDITITEDDEFNNLSYIIKPLVIDLGGNNVELEGAYLGLFENKNTLDVTVKNGSFTLTKSPVFKNFHWNNNETVYSASLNFEDITFAYGNGASLKDPALGYYVNATGPEVFTETFTNCTFDFRDNCPDGVVLFKLGVDEAGVIKHNVTVNGCKLLADDISKITIMQKNNTGSSIVFDKYNGEYMTISVPADSVDSAFDSYIFPTSKGGTVAEYDSTADGYDIYKLGVAPAPAAPVETEYGTIPADYADASVYPFAVFFSDKTFWHAGADWKTAMDKAISISAFGYGAIILIRDDITINEADEFNNMSYITNGLIIDLGGNNVELEGAYLGLFENKNELDVTVKNGSFTLTKNPVFKNFHVNSSDSVYSPVFKFEDVTFSYGSGATLTDPVLGYYVSANGPEVFTETFTNCTFDFRDNCPNGVVLFKLGIDEAGVIKHNVTVNGCKILADDMSKITIMKKNNTGSSIVFDKHNGEYMTISIPAGSEISSLTSCAFPSDEGDLMVLFKSNADGYDTYTLGVEQAPEVQLTAPADGEYIYSGSDLHIKGSMTAGYDSGSAKVYIDGVVVKTFPNNTLTVDDVIDADEIIELDYGKHRITLEAMYKGVKVTSSKEFVFTAIYNKPISDSLSGKGAEGSFASGILYSFTNNADYTFANNEGSVSLTRSSGTNGTDGKLYMAFADCVVDSGQFILKTKLTVSDPTQSILIDGDNTSGDLIELDYILKNGKFFSSDITCVADTQYDIEIIYDISDNTKTYKLNGEVIQDKVACYGGNAIGQFRSYEIVWYGTEAAQGSSITFDDFQLFHAESMLLVSNLEYVLDDGTSVAQEEWNDGLLNRDAQSVTVVMKKELDKLPSVLLEKSGIQVSASCSLSDDNTKVIITPDDGFEPGFSYNITLSDVVCEGTAYEKNILESFETDSYADVVFLVNGDELTSAKQIKKGDVVSAKLSDITLPNGVTNATYVLSVRKGLQLVAMEGKTMTASDDFETGFELTLPQIAEDGQFEVYLMVIDSYQGCVSTSKYMSIK